MPAPTNTSAGTAIGLGTLPASITQDVFDAGTTYTVWYKYTAQAGDNVIGLFGFGDLVGYKPSTNVYSDAGITQIVTGAANKAVQFPVTAGNTYYFEFVKNADVNPSSLSIAAEKAPSSPIVVGSLLVNDDTNNFPLAVLNGSNGSIINFVNPFPAGEAGCTLTNGIALIENRYPTVSDELVLFDAALAEIGRYPRPVGGTGFIRISCNYVDKFYIATAVNRKLGTLSSAGVVGGTIWTLAATEGTGFVGTIGISRDETICYYANTGATNCAVKRWDLVGNAPLANLAAGIANYMIQGEIIVLSDETILVSYFKSSGGVDSKIIHYATDGTVLNTYNLGANQINKLASAIDDPNSFWAWIWPGAVLFPVNRFTNIKVSDGSTLTTFDVKVYEAGVYQDTETATPDRFGPSASCPFWIQRVSLPGTPGSITVIKVTDPTGSSQSFSFTAGGGLSPGTFNLLDGQSQVFSGVAAGSGYSITEGAVANWTTTYSVSNGSPHTNITVAEGEAVTVTVTNTFTPGVLPGGIYKIVPGSGKTNDTLWVTISPDLTQDVKIPDPSISTALIGD